MTSPSTCSLISVGGYLGSLFLIGVGPERSADVTRGAELDERSSEKFRIQLPVALLRLGMLTSMVYIFFAPKTCSGFAPGASAAKFGGPVRSGASAICARGSILEASL